MILKAACRSKNGNHAGSRQGEKRNIERPASNLQPPTSSFYLTSPRFPVKLHPSIRASNPFDQRKSFATAFNKIPEVNNGE
jgi:hypothetical protein